jgi:hypothetical protein
MPRRRIEQSVTNPPLRAMEPCAGGEPRYAAPLCDWALLSEPMQLAVAREALARAAETIAGQAMVLAGEMEEGVLPDRGGPEALRLFAAVVRVTGREVIPAAGHA